MQWVKNKFNGFHSWMWANSIFIGMGLVGIGVISVMYGPCYPKDDKGLRYVPNGIAEYGALGDYFGGFVNPFMAFMGFGALLLTIRQQGKAAVDADEKHRESIRHQQDAARMLEVKHDDEKYIEHAVKSLERAYSTLVHQPADGPVSAKQDRLAWLDCARLILSAKHAYERVSPGAAGLRALYEGEEEYWRRQFYLLLKMTGHAGVLMTNNFFPTLKKGWAILILLLRYMRALFGSLLNF